MSIDPRNRDDMPDRPVYPPVRPVPVPPEVVAAGERVERVAQALCTESFGAEFLDEQTPEWQDYLRRLAAAAIAAQPPSPAEAAETLRDALRAHHPIMRSETGPFSGCRCGQVKLGQDVIAHVIGHLSAALASPAPAPQGEAPFIRYGESVSDGGDRWP